jgi:hypothetical protein
VPVHSPIRVFQDLLVTKLSCDAHVLTVHVVDRARDRKKIIFRFRDADVARDMADQVASWRDDRQPVTYVRTGNDGALIVEREAFERAMGDDDLDDQWA